jgi:hypothetical protein
VTRKIRDGKSYGERQYYVVVNGVPSPPSTAEPPPGLRWTQAENLARELADIHGLASMYTTERAQWDRTINSPFYKLDPMWPGWRWFKIRSFRRPDYIDSTGWYDGMIPGAPPSPSELAPHPPASFWSPKSPAAAKRFHTNRARLTKAKPKAAAKPKAPKPTRAKALKPSADTLTPTKAEAHTTDAAPPKAVPPTKRRPPPRQSEAEAKADGTDRELPHERLGRPASAPPE